MKKPATDEKRAFDMSLDIDAPRDDVWRALTEAEELMRWFPIQARVSPGIGGQVVWSWDEDWDWSSRIDAWEPGRLLRLVQDDYRPAEGAEPARVAMEFTLETHAGKTRLRLVHSGFGRGAAWDNELDSISGGWPAELRSLRLYLERHRGRQRQVGRAWAMTSLPREVAWEQLTGPGGYRLRPAEPVVGGAIEVTTPSGVQLAGTVEVATPRRMLTAIARDLDDGLFRLATWSDGQGQAAVIVWFATYGADAHRVDQLGSEAQAALDRLFSKARAAAQG